MGSGPLCVTSLHSATERFITELHTKKSSFDSDVPCLLLRFVRDDVGHERLARRSSACHELEHEDVQLLIDEPHVLTLPRLESRPISICEGDGAWLSGWLDEARLMQPPNASASVFSRTYSQLDISSRLPESSKAL